MTKKYLKQKGVTLIEVLVAIAVVMILLGTYWVAIRPSMMRKAYDTEAIAGLRGWFNAYQMYRADHEDKEPAHFGMILAYNKGADWNVPVAKRNPECKRTGFFYGRHELIQKYAEKVNLINKYDPEKEPVFSADHRCRLFPGKTYFDVYSSRKGKIVQSWTYNLKSPGIVGSGRIIQKLMVTPFEGEFASQIMSIKR
ncbi:MAG TPA: type II secretion system protein [Fimbriimonadaceae bacterium]|nr:type II secretion system protein [Fimbriimonadaceae bacterium]HRJ33448.1 type II secretion system protein [Fimbriimonadaceae bacterium]